MAEANSNPYRVLRISRSASRDEIQAAYDLRFSEYESAAQEGEEEAIQMLERINAAYDTLIASAGVPTPSTSTYRERKRPAPRPRALPPVEPTSRTPFILAGIVGLAVLAVVVIFLLTRGGSTSEITGSNSSASDAYLNSPLLTGDEATRGAVVAVVNGRPIYEKDYKERVAADREIALSDPLLGVFLNNFEGITGTRALDILQQDALDRLINVEIIHQQAVKEGVFPNTAQQREIIEEAKKRDLKPGENFETFLSSRGITEQQYNRRIIRNLIHTVMAERNMGQGENSDERIENFAKWVCDLRDSTNPDTKAPNYRVTINLTFTVENPPCTSGLPLPDIALPGITPEAPEPISTPGP